MKGGFILDHRYNEDGSLNLEKLSQAFEDMYKQSDAEQEMRQLLEKLIEIK